MEQSPSDSDETNQLPEKRLDCLLEEYRAMYGLVLFRMGSLDRRVPIAGATLTATLASAAAIPDQAMMIVFMGLPLALVWFLRTTINHARSFEDVLRRIEQIEVEINRLLGKETVCFQSRHPSKGREVGGRTGRETVNAVLVTVVTLLVGCGWMFLETTDAPQWGRGAYIGFLGVVFAYFALIVVRLRGYAYEPR